MKKKILVCMLLWAVVFSVAANDKTWYAEKFPENLQNASGKKISVDTLGTKKLVAVYFSASWCPPCRAFTPQLVKFYKNVAAKSNLEIIFVSSDKNEKAMQDYMKKYKMPWLAVPFKDPLRAKLKKDFGVSGIPTLIVLDSNGRIVSKKARNDVAKYGNKAVDSWLADSKDNTGNKAEITKSDDSGREKHKTSKKKKTKKSGKSKKSGKVKK